MGRNTEQKAFPVQAFATILPAASTMKERIFETQQWLPRPMEAVFEFFADAGNLQVLTPPWLNFCILTPQPLSLGVGALIDYRLRVHGIPVSWQTEITCWEPPHRFVDEQKQGPYRLWIHEHRFVSERDGTSIIDHVRYAPPGGWLVDRIFVRRDIERIFAFRRTKLLELFGG
jgi:ligand-binding SRPBCC domain-containing protein